MGVAVYAQPWPFGSFPTRCDIGGGGRRTRSTQPYTSTQLLVAASVVIVITKGRPYRPIFVFEIGTTLSANLLLRDDPHDKVHLDVGCHTFVLACSKCSLSLFGRQNRSTQTHDRPPLRILVRFNDPPSLALREEEVEQRPEVNKANPIR